MLAALSGLDASSLRAVPTYAPSAARKQERTTMAEALAGVKRLPGSTALAPRKATTRFELVYEALQASA